MFGRFLVGKTSVSPLPCHHSSKMSAHVTLISRKKNKNRLKYVQILLKTVLLVEQKRARLWSGRPGVQILGLSNWRLCCQRLVTVATFQKELCCFCAMTRRWAGQTHYTLRHCTESIMKDLILRFYFAVKI